MLYDSWLSRLVTIYFWFSVLDDNLDKANKEQKELQNKLEYWKVCFYYNIYIFEAII